ncbi:MAG: tetratricopeptide repeat protein, partial [Phycisphaerales bacterium]|nr:tetratricopeptide repeat protein [Phycisphaerales bacterium]
MPMMSPQEAYMLGKEKFVLGHYRAAMRMAEPLYRQHPHHPPIVALYVSILLRLQRPAEAVAIAKRSLRTVNLPVHRTSLLMSIADGLKQLNRFEEGIEFVNDELKAHPDDPYLIELHSHLYSMIDKNELSAPVSDEAWNRGLHHIAIATAYTRSVMDTDQLQTAVDRLDGSLQTADQGTEEASLIMKSTGYTQLGHAYNKLKRYDDAMDAYRTGNQLHPNQYNDQDTHARAKSLLDAWTPESFVGVQRP